MAKNKKTRHCPAVDRDIKAAECGANRNSRYACPADCGHNPLAPANYDQFRELEEKVDPKSMKWVFDEPDTGVSILREFKKIVARNDYHETHAFVSCNLFFETDSEGRTAMERWREAGFPGLKNDERALVQMKMGTRVAVLEVHRILDCERVEAVDLLEANPKPFVIIDRSLAAIACRFTVALAWLYETPHFRRISGALLTIPEMESLEPGMIVTELVNHLSGPSGEAEMRRWLALNFKRFDVALHASSLARRRTMLEAVDAQFCAADYALTEPSGECLGVLDAVDAVDADDLSDMDCEAGFRDARVWFDDESHLFDTSPEAGRPVLGRILIRDNLCRLEASGAKRFASFRRKFENQMGDRARFEAERREDAGAQMRMQDPDFDESLVPPRLLENTQRIVLQSSRIAVDKSKRSKDEVEGDMFRAHEEAWLGNRIPAFDDLTPREAAGDEVMRPRLLRMMKNRIRAVDEENLRTGGNRNMDWMIDELGLGEIRFDPPPPRKRPEIFESDGDELENDEMPFAPSLPPEPLSADEVKKRMQIAFEFETATDAMEEMERCGSTLLEDVDHILGDRLAEEESGPLTTALIALWYALVPPGCLAPIWDVSEFDAAYSEEIDRLARLPMVEGEWAEAMIKTIKEGPQPAVAVAVTDIYYQACEAPSPLTGKKNEPSFLAIACIKAGISVIDGILRVKSD